MKIAGIRIVVVFVLQALWPGMSHSEEPASPKINEELSKQEAIYRSTENKCLRVIPSTDRLRCTPKVCPPISTTHWQALAPKIDGWILEQAGARPYWITTPPDYDLAHPEGQERRGGKAHAVAMSIEDRRTPLWQQNAAGLGANQIQYLFNRRLRSIRRKNWDGFSSLPT